MQVQSFLVNYQKKARPVYENFFKFWQQKANQAGNIPLEMLAKIAALYPQGKQVRGALTVLGFELAGGKMNKDIYQASVMVELMHTALLVADDVFDWDDLRRGQQTIHRQWETYFPKKQEKYGVDMAFDSALMALYLAPLALENTEFDDYSIVKASNYFFRKVVATAWGEALDISTPYQTLKQKQKSVATIHKYKTVEYTGVLPLVFGALLAGKKDKTWLANLEKYGQILGRIFQIQDDVIGSFGDSQKSGKANDSDIKQARWTKLTEVLFTKANSKDLKILTKLYEQKSRNNLEIPKIKNLMQKYQVLDEVKVQANKLIKKALAIILKITDNKDHQETLENILEYLVKRDK